VFEELAIFNRHYGVYIVFWQVLERNELLFLALLFVGYSSDQLGLEDGAVEVSFGIAVSNFGNSFAAGTEDDG
jgi:hypothetical protein